MPASSLTGMKVPDRPPTLPEAIAPPFLTASISRARAAVEPGTPIRPTPIASTISATESPVEVVGASEISTMPKSIFIKAGQLPADQLARPGDLEDGPLDDLGKLRQVAIGVLGDDVVHDARTGDADIERVIRLADAVMGPGHEGIVLGDIGEDGQLGAADAVLRAVGEVLDDVADLDHGVHVDPGGGGGEVQKAAHALRLGEGLGNRRR